MAYIDCDKCYHGRVCAHRHHYHDMIVECNHHIPTVDVAEVTRCKDCKRCYEKRTKRNNQLMRFCMRMDGNEYQVNANDFCSYGTPKERGGEK